ncbi:MAG: hypothetical protein AB1445_05275 [Bacillota bacterium]
MLAYVSVLEVTPEEAGEGEPAGCLRVDGVPLQNTAYGNWILAPSAALTGAVTARVHSFRPHYDGVFLDTLGDVEDERIPPAQRLQAAVDVGRLVRSVRRAWPEAIVVQNMGFWGPHRFTRDYVDGLCWEDFPGCPARVPHWLDAKARELATWCGSQRRVLLLGQDSPQTDLEWVGGWARRYGWLAYLAPGDYTRGIGRAV